MIDTHHRQRGYAVLALTLAILLAVSLLTVFVTKVIVSEHRSSHNVYREQQAKQAAQAGLAYAINNIETNRATVSDNDTVTGTLPGNSTYSASYSFVGGNNDTVNITSTGYSVDGTVSQTVSQQISWVEAGGIAVNGAIISVGYVQLSGNVEIENVSGDVSIATGHNSLAMSGNAESSSLAGSSDRTSIGDDVVLGDATLSGLSSDQLAQQTLGSTVEAMKSGADQTYTHSSSHNYNSELDNVTGGKIVINQTGGMATINGNTDVGTPADPVTLIVDGDITINGNTNFYGNIIATGSVFLSGNTEITGLVFSGATSGMAAISGNTEIEGALVVAGSLMASGNFEIDYNGDVIENGASSGGSYGKVPGTWKDN